MKKISVLLMAVFLLVVLSGCGGQSGADDKAKKNGENKKVLRVGTEPTFPPFEFLDEKDANKYVGFDMDLIRAIGKQMGYEVEINNMGFDALIPALDAGNIDVAAAGISITDERKEKVLFTDAYYDSGLTIAVLKENDEIKTFDDLKGKFIAVQIGTTGSIEANKIEGATVKEFNTNNESFLELKNKGVDAVINDRPVNDYFLTNGGADYAKAVGEPKDAESYGFAASKKNQELVNKMNKALEALKKNGEYDKIYEKWFGKKQ